MIDLHVHTNHSDGTDSVEELLVKAEEKKLELISITDHDSVDAYYELEKNSEIRKKFSGKIIVGSELKTFYKDVPVEVLAYGIDYKKLRIHKVDTEKMQKENLEKYKIISKSLGLKIDENELYIDINNPSKRWASFALATELLKYEENKEIIKEIGEFTTTNFYRIHQSNVSSPFYINENDAYIDLEETISRIHEAGGLAFLAHGYIYPYENKDEVIEEILTSTDIDGLECIYTTFSDEERKRIIDLCKKYKRYMSGGSDYHAKNKPDIELGTGTNGNVKVEMEFINDWIEKVRKV